MEKIVGASRSIQRFLVASLIGMLCYVVVGLAASGHIARLYPPDTVPFASTHFNDARQYVFICISGFNLTTAFATPTLGSSRLSWMPLYPEAICGLHNIFGVSLVYAGFWISCLAAAGTLFFTMLTLRNLNIRAPARLAFLVFAPPISAIYLYLAGAEVVFLLVSAILMFLLTSSMRNQLLRNGLGFLVGFLLMMAKPNALSLVLPLGFAFVHLSWKRSKAAGYTRTLNQFIPDLIYHQLALWLPKRNTVPITYDWMPLFNIAGIFLEFTFWEWYSSWFSGVPYFFTQQQLQFWVRPWASGDIGTMFLYFAQAFRGFAVDKPYRMAAAWYLLVLVSALIPAFSARVPTLIRGMILPLPLFLLATGAVHQYDRYIASLITVSLGWVFWVQGKRWRWGILIGFALLTSLIYPSLHQAGVFGNTVVIDR